MTKDLSRELSETVRNAAQSGSSLQISGGGTKNFYGRTPQGEPLPVTEHSGIVSYEPTELVITARAGTPLRDIEAALAANGQYLAFEPPHFGDSATLGGTLACGFSGPARPYTGSARDFVLGVKLINGNGEILSFGGQVMKNVAGYDVSRLMVGALGTLGVLLEASLKVLPRPAAAVTLKYVMSPAQALQQMNTWAGQPVPLSAACHIDNTLYVRLSGSEQAVSATKAKLGGEEEHTGSTFWESLREHRLDFFHDGLPLWRISVPAAAELELSGPCLIDWGGAQRWLKTSDDIDEIWKAVQKTGGHATLFRNGDRVRNVFQPLSGPLLQLHRNLKRAFDPNGVLNPGRMYSVW